MNIVIDIYNVQHRYPPGAWPSVALTHKDCVRRRADAGLLFVQFQVRPEVSKRIDSSEKPTWKIVDYTKLKQKTFDGKFSLPNHTDILDKLEKCQYFITLDLANSFHQIEIHKADPPKPLL